MDWTDSLKINLKINGLQEQIDKLTNCYDIKIKNLEWKLSFLEKRIKKIEDDKTLVRRVHIRRIKK